MPDDIQEPPAPHSEPAATPAAPEHQPEPEHYSDSELPPEVYRADQPQYAPAPPTPAEQVVATVPPKPDPPPPPPPPPKPPSDDDEDDDPEERGMLRMSFMEHLEELRGVILRAVAGVLVAFFASFLLAKQIWDIVSAPAVNALIEIGAKPAKLVAIAPLEMFNVIYLKLPLLMAVFLGSPWIFYQIWSFISPGLYKREKRWAVPFILATAGLFIIGGLFAYFVAFRYGLVFLLGIGRDINISPMVSIDTYFDLFVNVTLGVGLVFEMPVILFFLTLLRVASPRFLLKHSRYAILAITIIAAIVTPTPDAFNMTLFTIPMIALYFLGLFASYLLVLRREGKKFPWYIVGLVLAGVLLVAAGVIALLIYHYHFHWILKWPFLIK
jgi:sec-independent protein translocase protein TatC